MGYIFLGLGSITSSYAAAYLLFAIAKPNVFVDLFAVNFAERRGAKDWAVYFRIGVTLIGLGLLFYNAAEALVMIVPEDWGGLNEDGEWEYTRYGLQATFAGFASLVVLSSVEDRAEETLRWRVLSRKVRVLENEFRFHADKRSIDRVLRDAKKEFEDKFDLPNSEYERRLYTETISSLKAIAEERADRLYD
ncbi:MAG: hypothetical protein AAF250_04705 [Pseudomonadota bacterium]